MTSSNAEEMEKNARLRCQRHHGVVVCVELDLPRTIKQHVSAPSNDRCEMGWVRGRRGGGMVVANGRKKSKERALVLQRLQPLLEPV